MRLSASATMFSLYLPRSGSRFCARISVSTNVGWNVRPRRSHAAATKPVSKSALCAQSGRSPTNSRNCGSASEMSGAPVSIASVMPVSSMIFGCNFRFGSTNIWNVSITSPRRMMAAPISMIVSCCELSPVVSRSNATNSWSKSKSRSPWTAMRSSTSLT